MRRDLRPYWVKRVYLLYRSWYAEHFLRPHFDYLGDNGTYMKPWYVDVNGPNVRLGHCATVIGDVTDGDRLQITWNGETVVDVPPRTVAHDGPVYQRPVISFWSRETIATSRQESGLTGVSEERPRHWKPV